jgi:hypothetical protein
MDIRYLSRRNHELAATSGTREARQTVDAGQVAQTAQASTSASEAAAQATARQPASQARFSPAGRLINVLQAFEERHPEETQRVLGNIADKLRSDAEHAGVFSERLTRWADRFQEAADSGDMSKLMPRLSSHFGVRAYQQAEQPEPDATVEHVAGTAEAQANAAAARSATIATQESVVEAENTAAAERVSGIRPRPVTVPESATAEKTSSSDIRNRPVTVPESATAEKTSSSDIRNRPVTVPESSKMAVNQ